MTETEVQNPEINKYELMVIIDPDLGSAAIKKRLDKIKKLVIDNKGSIFYEDIWGLRDLAYKIQKRTIGYFAVYDFESEQDILKEIDNTLKLQNEVLRHMITKLPFNYETRSFAVIEEEIPKEIKPREKTVRKTIKKEKEEVPVEEKIVEVKEEKEEIKAPEAPAEEPEIPTEETVKAPEPEPEKEEPKKETTLEDVDEKLKNILDNPDYNF